jgi:hypothetical protein
MRYLALALLLIGCSSKEKVPELDCPYGTSIHSVTEKGGTTKICMYSDGQKHGPYRGYGPDGKLVAEGEFFHDQAKGLTTVYGPDGKVFTQAILGPGTIQYLVKDGVAVSP